MTVYPTVDNMFYNDVSVVCCIFESFDCVMSICFYSSMFLLKIWLIPKPNIFFCS